MRPRSASSSSSVSSISPQFQSFTLSPSPIVGSLRPPLAALKFSAASSPSFHALAGSQPNSLSGSTMLSEGDPSAPLAMLEVPINPLKPYQGSNPTVHDVPSFPSSPTQGIWRSGVFEAADKPRRRSLVKSPSRGELGRSATRKRSGFLRSVLPGRKED